jgi:hypothetical protein
MLGLAFWIIIAVLLVFIMVDAIKTKAVGVERLLFLVALLLLGVATFNLKL